MTCWLPQKNNCMCVGDRLRPVVRRATPDLVSTSVSCGVQFVFTLLFICYILITLCIHYIIYIILYTPIHPAAAPCVRLLFFNLFQKKGQNFFWKFFRYMVVSIWKTAVFYLEKAVINTL